MLKILMLLYAFCAYILALRIDTSLVFFQGFNSKAIWNNYPLPLCGCTSSDQPGLDYRIIIA